MKRLFRLIRRLLGLETVAIRANVEAQVWDVASGRLLAVSRTHNLVVTAGLNLLVSLLANDGPTGITHFAVGTGTTAEAAGQTTLVTEVHRDTVTQRTQSAAQLVVKYYLPSTAANDSTLTEVGVFNASSGGTMVARARLSEAIPKTSAVAVTFVWEFNFAAVAG